MQVVITVLCKKGRSLRDAIGADAKSLQEHYLEVVREKQAGRSPGWAKLRSTDAQRGAINITWDPYANSLTARVVTRGSNRPSTIVGDFIGYLTARHKRRVKAITVHTI